MASLKPRGTGYHKEELDAKFSIFIYVLCSLFCYSTRVLSIIDTLVCYMAFRRQVVQGSSSWQRAGALAENLAEKGA